LGQPALQLSDSLLQLLDRAFLAEDDLDQFSLGKLL